MIGVAFAVVGLFFIGYGYLRQRRVEEAIARGGYAPFGSHTGFVFAAMGVLLGVGTMIVILVHSA